jgi:hypothetical protein
MCSEAGTDSNEMLFLCPSSSGRNEMLLCERSMSRIHPHTLGVCLGPFVWAPCGWGKLLFLRESWGKLLCVEKGVVLSFTAAKELSQIPHIFRNMYN